MSKPKVEKRFHEEFRVSERKTNLGNRALILSVIGNILIFVTSKGYFDAQRDNRLQDMMNAKVSLINTHEIYQYVKYSVVISDFLW